MVREAQPELWWADPREYVKGKDRTVRFELGLDGLRQVEVLTR